MRVFQRLAAVKSVSRGEIPFFVKMIYLLGVVYPPPLRGKLVPAGIKLFSQQRQVKGLYVEPGQIRVTEESAKILSPTIVGSNGDDDQSSIGSTG